MRAYIIIILTLAYSLNLQAQEKVMLYSHYTFNGLAINPGTAGTYGMLSTSLSHRSQWIGFEGAPSYNVFAVHTPLKNSRTGIGFLTLNESAGLRKQTGLYFNYAHRLSLGGGILSMGLKAGLSMGAYEQVETGYDDFLYNENALKYVVPNFGLGVFYYTSKFHAGISVPSILGYNAGSNGEIVPYHDFSKYACYLTAGYKMPVGTDWKVYPSVFMKYEKSSGIVGDYGMSLIYKEIAGPGASYRNTGAIAMWLTFVSTTSLNLAWRMITG
jgi:type IX secretion system PorP/SprF family membrane protein